MAAKRERPRQGNSTHDAANTSRDTRGILDNFHPLILKANTAPTDNGFKIVSWKDSWWGKRMWYTDIYVTTVHLSCSSDVYQGIDHRYAGFILYGYNGETDWKLNGVHCKTGYIVIRDTDSYAVKQYIGKAAGQVHGAVYMSVFGEDVSDKVVGEGFAWQYGEFKSNSITFNEGTERYHDKEKQMSDEGEKCVHEVLQKWALAGLDFHSLPSTRTWNVKDLL